MMCSTGALLCSQTLISLRHRPPPANVRCIGCCNHAQVTGHAGGVPKATLERGCSVELPSEGNMLVSIMVCFVFYAFYVLGFRCVSLCQYLVRPVSCPRLVRLLVH